MTKYDTNHVMLLVFFCGGAMVLFGTDLSKLDKKLCYKDCTPYGLRLIRTRTVLHKILSCSSETLIIVGGLIAFVSFVGIGSGVIPSKNF